MLSVTGMPAFWLAAMRWARKRGSSSLAFIALVRSQTMESVASICFSPAVVSMSFLQYVVEQRLVGGFVAGIGRRGLARSFRRALGGRRLRGHRRGFFFRRGGG